MVVDAVPGSNERDSGSFQVIGHLVQVCQLGTQTLLGPISVRVRGLFLTMGEDMSSVEGESGHVWGRLLLPGWDELGGRSDMVRG